MFITTKDDSLSFPLPFLPQKCDFLLLPCVWFQANIAEVEVSIPAKLHNSLIGTKGRLIRSIMEECGGVHIHFPVEGSGSDTVVIRGPSSDVEKAKKQLLHLAEEKVSMGRERDSWQEAWSSVQGSRFSLWKPLNALPLWRVRKQLYNILFMRLCFCCYWRAFPGPNAHIYNI